MSVPDRPTDSEVVHVDAVEVIRYLADPDEETLLSAARFARDWLLLDADTPDDRLPDVVERADAELGEQMQIASDQTADAIRTLRSVLRVHQAVPLLGHHDQDEQLITTTADRIGPVADLTPAQVLDVVRQTVTQARAQAIEAAVLDVGAAQRAITEAEAAHTKRIRGLKAELQTRLEDAVAAGRSVGDLADDLKLTRQRVHQIRNGSR